MKSCALERAAPLELLTLTGIIAATCSCHDRYHGCSDVHPCNTSSGAIVTNSSAGDDITDFFAVSFSVTAAGALSLLGLFFMRHKKKQGAGPTDGE